MNVFQLALNHVASPIADMAAALNSELPAGQAPEWIELIPSGDAVIGRDGRQWRNDQPAAIVAAFNAGGVDIVIDIEHSTELKAPKGDPAPAAGWLTELKQIDGALHGRVAWTPEGANAVSNREYRYISPVFHYDRATGRILELISVGLTNRPNLRMPALNHQQPDEEEPMLKNVCKALGLPEEATANEAVNAISALKTNLETARNRAETPDLAKFVPRADYDAAVAKATNAESALAAKQAAELDAEIAREVESALTAGKITPATKDYYTAMCRTNDGLDAFRKFVASAPVIGADSHLNQTPPDTGMALNAEQQKIAKMFGNSAEDLKKYGMEA